MHKIFNSPLSWNGVSVNMTKVDKLIVNLLYYAIFVCIVVCAIICSFVGYEIIERLMEISLGCVIIICVMFLNYFTKQIKQLKKDLENKK